MEHLTYKTARKELDIIISEIENGDADIDTLSAKIKRAGELINFCRNKLRETETDVNNILKTFETGENNSSNE